MSEIAIKVENISKKYSIGAKANGSFRETLVNKWEALMGKIHVEAEEFWALKDVSFEVKQGDVLGIIGKNGAGKSTLLKILSRITEPTYGRIEINGRVSSLLEVGTGFHPELTGRENIFLNGTILGMSSKEVKLKFDEIVDFSGVEKFIDTPVKHYSSGMYVRLAFAVVANLEPEILIIDEVLAVGDLEFQKKCIGKMEDVAQNGRTILFVSHNLSIIDKMCTHGMFLETGNINYLGSVAEAISKLTFNKETENVIDISHHTRTSIKSELFKFIQIKIHGENSAKIYENEGVIVELGFSVYKPINNLAMGLVICDSQSNVLIECRSFKDFPGLNIEQKGEYHVKLEIIPKLRAGIYSINIGAISSAGHLDYVPSVWLLEINHDKSNSEFWHNDNVGLFFINHKWQFLD